LVNLGECVDRTTKSPVLPLKDIYVKQIGLLVELKLRLGRGLARGTLDQNGNTSRSFTDAVRELELGLALMRSAAFQRKPIEAQLLFSLGICYLYVLRNLITDMKRAVDDGDDNDDDDGDNGGAAVMYDDDAIIIIYEDDNRDGMAPVLAAASDGGSGRIMTMMMMVELLLLWQ